MATIDVLDANSVPKQVQLPPAPGRAGEAASRPVALCNEDKAALDAIPPALAPLQTLLSQLAGFTDGIEGLLVAIGNNSDGLEAALAAQSAILTALQGLLNTQNGYVDGLEGALATQNTTLTALQTLITTQGGYLDGIEGALAAQATTLTALQGLITTQAGYLDGVEGALATVATGLATLGAKIDTLTEVGMEGIEVAAASGSVLLGAAGAAGDRMVGILVKPSTALGVGAISIKDGAAGEDIILFPGGDLPSILPFYIPWSGVAATGWRLTTGAGASVRAQGNFT